MPRPLVILVLLIVLIVGGLFFFSSQVEPVEPQVIEEPVALPSETDADEDA